MEFFTYEEVLEKNQRLVRTKQSSPDIPVNSCGTVIGFSWIDLKADQYVLKIELNTTRSRISCFFTKTGYQEFIQEIDMSQR